jgi:small subunit ribosomal protein S6
MRIYESTFILSPQADDVAFDRQIKAVTDLIHRYEGKVLQADRWGIRRLAYPIKKFTQGYYARVIFEASQTVLNELERLYRIEEPYIRNLTVRFEGKLDREKAFEPADVTAIKAVPEHERKALSEGEDVAADEPDKESSSDDVSTEEAAEEEKSAAGSEE